MVSRLMIDNLYSVADHSEYDNQSMVLLTIILTETPYYPITYI